MTSFIGWPAHWGYCFNHPFVHADSFHQLCPFSAHFLFFEVAFPAQHQWALAVFWKMSLWFFSTGWGNPDSGQSGGSMSTEKETLCVRASVLYVWVMSGGKHWPLPPSGPPPNVCSERKEGRRRAAGERKCEATLLTTSMFCLPLSCFASLTSQLSKSPTLEHLALVKDTDTLNQDSRGSKLCKNGLCNYAE